MVLAKLCTRAGPLRTSPRPPRGHARRASEHGSGSSPSAKALRYVGPRRLGVWILLTIFQSTIQLAAMLVGYWKRHVASVLGDGIPNRSDELDISRSSRVRELLSDGCGKESNELCARGLRLDNGLLHGRRKIDMNEKIGREEIVFAGLIDDAKHAVTLGIGIAEGLIDLSDLQRRLVSRVSHADDELVFFCRHDQSR